MRGGSPQVRWIARVAAPVVFVAVVVASLVIAAVSASAAASSASSADPVGKYDGAVAVSIATTHHAADLENQPIPTLAGDAALVYDSSANFYATNTAGQRLYRAVEPDELADIVGTGAYRTVPGLEGKYFFPTQGQADDFAALMTKADIGGPYCTTSGCIPSNVLSQIEAIPIAGEGPAYFIPEEFLSLIDDIVIHGG